MSFLDTVGLEIEGGGLEQGAVGGIINKSLPDWRNSLEVERDASVESVLRQFTPTISIYNHDTLSKKCYGEYDDNTVMGYEIKTKPLEFPDAEVVMFKLLNALRMNGEIISPRASTHIHVGYAESFQLLQSAFAIGLWIEPLMYKIAGMGNLFRGHINNSIYCRPLELSVGVKGADGSNYSLLDTISVFESKSTIDFWKHYAIWGAKKLGGINRYHPARYFGCNLLSIPLHGTLEFRYFNSCLDSAWVLSVTRFCQAITELTTKVSSNWVIALQRNLKGDKRKSILDRWENTDYHNLLDKIEWALDKHDVSYNTSNVQRECLRSIIESSKTPKFSTVLPRTHIQKFVLTADDLDTGYHRLVKDIEDSGYLDIHNVSEHNFSVFSAEEE